ncbi:MAG: MBL fold metallo-hydrolase [Gemmiger sp.]
MCWMSGRAMPCCFCQDSAYCLIDTGPVEAEDALLYDLDVLGVPSLDYLVLTHPHADHTGNARAVLSSRSNPAAAAVAAHGG